MVLGIPALVAAWMACPGPASDTAALLADARAAISEDRVEDAVRLFESALKESPEDLQVLLGLAESLSLKGDEMPIETEAQWAEALSLYEQAEAHVEHAIDLAPESGRVWGVKGRTLLRMGRADEAIATLYHAQSLGLNEVPLLVDLAQALMLSRQYAIDAGNLEVAEGRVKEAQDILETAHSRLDIQAEVQKTLGDCYLAQGMAQKALQAYRRAISIRPGDTSLHDSYLVAVEASKSFDETIDFYTGLIDERALADWYSGRTHEIKGHVSYNVDRDYDEAVREYRSSERELFASAAANPDYAEAAHRQIPLLRSYQGYAYTRSGKLAEAEAAFLAALDREPTLANAHAGLKALLDAYWVQIGGEGAGAEAFDEIRAFAARLCVVQPDDADNWNNYGFFARECGKYEESYQAYRRAMSLAPDNARILNDTALILVYHLGRDLDMAESWLREARDLAEEDLASAVEGGSPSAVDAATETYGDSLVNLMVLFDRVGDRERAVEVLRRIEDELPERSELRAWHQRLLPDVPLPASLTEELPPALPVSHPPIEQEHKESEESDLDEAEEGEAD